MKVQRSPGSGRNGALNWARRGSSVIQEVTACQERSSQLVVRGITAAVMQAETGMEH